MIKRDRRTKGAKKILSVLLFLSWISFMALAGFFIPSFLTQFPVFQVSRVELEGNRAIRFEELKSVIEDLSTNLLNLREEELERALNERFGNRIKRVFLEKSFTPEGIVLKVKIEERVPLCRLKLGKGYRLMDAEGVIFKPRKGEGSDLPVVKTYDIDLLVENFPNLKEVLELGMPMREVVVRRDAVVLKLVDKEVLLPPLPNFPDNLLPRIEMIYNFTQEKVDLRYGRFILVRN